MPQASAIVAAVAHREYELKGTRAIIEKLRPGGVVADVKSIYDAAVLQAAGVRVWRM